ncbi:MAG: response regulator [Elusimicrobia bacterium]|nr:response regulator [Elusimicrobiota bacterium]
MKAVVCDDDPMNRTLLTDALAMVGCQVFQAENGAQAIALAKQEHPDFVLMDQTMPDLKGYDAIKEIRKETGMEQVPYVMITGDFNVQYDQEDDQMTNCAFLPKPYSIDQLMTTIGNALGRPFP